MSHFHIIAVSILAIGFFTLYGCTKAKDADSNAAETKPSQSATVTTGNMCGGIAGLSCQSENDHCAMDAGLCVRIADAAGICTPKPEVCTHEYRPVCGCDGKTYPNACVAASQEVSVAAQGVCEGNN